MKVFKFGGASVKDAEGIKKLAEIVKNYDNHLIIVVSAMGKTTNNLERLLGMYINRQVTFSEAFYNVKNFHSAIIQNLFPDEKNKIYSDIESTFDELHHMLNQPPGNCYDYEYDRLVSFGEIFSTKIVSAYLNKQGIKNKWIDARKLIKTDNTFREAKVLWEESNERIKTTFTFRDAKIYLTQGFIGSTMNNETTTLGREGSDFTGAIIAYILDCKDLTIWKDVPGVLNADPKWFDNTVKLEKITYQDAIELAYYGASVIHPKTIKPLQNKSIELHVKSFYHPEEKGTIIGNVKYKALIPSFIFKMDQVLLKISPKDFSFIAEDSLTSIFHLISQHRIKINLMQNSAISFQICTNSDPLKIPALLSDLKKDFNVVYDTGLELITIRYYDEKTINRVMINKELVLKQITKNTIQLVVRDLG